VTVLTGAGKGERALKKLVQGFILGLIIVLPGMSGGTVFIILGIYEDLVQDIAAFKLKPYWPMLIGTVGGIFLGGTAFALFLSSHRDLTVAFLMGFLLASIKAVLLHRPALTVGRTGILLLGFLAGFLMSGEPVGILEPGEVVNPVLLALGGAISSAAMFIPGVPGSSILIVMGIYDNILFYVKDITLFPLALFGAGALVGVFLLARVMEIIYFRYRAPVSYFFAGLIAGSARVLWPADWDISTVLLFAVGFYLVWRWGGGEVEKSKEV